MRCVALVACLFMTVLFFACWLTLVKILKSGRIYHVLTLYAVNRIILCPFCSASARVLVTTVIFIRQEATSEKCVYRYVYLIIKVLITLTIITIMVFSMKKLFVFYIYNNFINRRLRNYFTKMEIILLYETFST